MRASLPSSARFRLRPLTVGDADVHLAAEDEATVRWSSGGVSSRQNVLDFLERCGTAWADGGHVFDLGIELSDGPLAGLVGLQHGVDFLSEGQANITYTVYPDHRGLGLATESARMAGELARHLWGVTELVIRCAPDNPASARVAQRLGYQKFHRTDDAHGLLDWYVLAYQPHHGVGVDA